MKFLNFDLQVVIILVSWGISLEGGCQAWGIDDFGTGFDLTWNIGHFMLSELVISRGDNWCSRAPGLW